MTIHFALLLLLLPSITQGKHVNLRGAILPEEPITTRRLPDSLHECLFFADAFDPAIAAGGVNCTSNTECSSGQWCLVAIDKTRFFCGIPDNEVYVLCDDEIVIATTPVPTESTPSPTSPPPPPTTSPPTTPPPTPPPVTPPPSPPSPTSPVTPAPISLPSSTPPPSSSSTSTPVLMSIKSLAYGGCMEDSTKNNQVYMNECDTNKLTQKFKYDGTHIRTGSNKDMCLQASYNPPAEEAEWIRVRSCDSSNSLQKFSWDMRGGEISVTDYPTLCLTFRGVNVNIDSDFILLTKCRTTDNGVNLRWKGVA